MGTSENQKSDGEEFKRGFRFDNDDSETRQSKGFQFGSQSEPPKSAICRKENLGSLDEYVSDKNDYEIYSELTNPDGIYSQLFEPLKFFQTFYKYLCLIENNSFRPMFIIQNLNELALTREQSYFLYEKIVNFFSNERTSNEKIDICCREIVKLQKSLCVQSEARTGNTYDPEPSPRKEKDIDDTDLDDFLTDNFNLKIYQDLTEGNEKDVFVEPVIFFRLFYKQLVFIAQNPPKPLALIRNINQLSINEQQRRLLLFYINDLLSKEFIETSSEQIKVSQILIEKEFNKLNEKLFPEVLSQSEIMRNLDNYFRFDFELIKEHLKTLQSNNSRIVYLIEAKTDYEQRKNEINYESTNFVGKCNSEIEKLKQLIQLEAGSEQKEIVTKDAVQTNEKIGERETRQKALGLTLDRAVWAISYLFESAETKCHNTEKAKFISFMTGFSETKIAQSFSRIERIKSEMEEKTETSKKNSDDYKIIRKLFETLNLTEIQKQIDKDFGN